MQRCKPFCVSTKWKTPPPPPPLHHHPFRSVQYLKRDLLLFSEVTHLSQEKTVWQLSSLADDCWKKCLALFFILFSFSLSCKEPSHGIKPVCAAGAAAAVGMSEGRRTTQASHRMVCACSWTQRNSGYMCVGLINKESAKTACSLGGERERGGGGAVWHLHGDSCKATNGREITTIAIKIQNKRHGRHRPSLLLLICSGSFVFF